MENQTKAIIFGIDPGTSVTGYAMLQVDGKAMQLLSCGIISLKDYASLAEKYKKLFYHALALIEEFKATEMAIEAPFYGKNIQAMLKLGRAQGISIAAAVAKGLPFCEYLPRSVKQSVTGNGNASKEQVALMVCELVSRTAHKGLPHDATDALAVAICHVNKKRLVL